MSKTEPQPQIQITNPHFFVLLTFMLVGTTFLTMPTTLADRVMQDGWWIPLVSMVVAFPFVYLIILFGRWYPNQSLPEMLVTVFGNVVGKALLMIVLLLPFYNGAGHTYFFTAFMNTHFFRNTPTEFIVPSLMFVIIIGAFMGIEVLGRAAIISFVPFIAFLILITIFSFGDVEIRYLLPILEQEPMRYIDAVFLFSSKIIATNLVLMLFFYPKNIEKKYEAEKMVYLAYFFSCFLLFVTTFMAITILGPDLTKVKLFTGFSLGQRVELGDIIERLESMLLIMFFVSFYFMNALYLYIFTVGVSFLTKVNNYKPLVIPLGLIYMYFALTEFTNLIEDSAYYFYGSFFFIIPVCYVIPLLLFMFTIIHRKRNGLPLFPNTKQKKKPSHSSYANRT
ncbi:hypothetical protein DH09_14625 [Bacillaceae bacterium JMAK1]|nr:hypothetical protein DH09_14625 [Bacillaceae bacterium JMAK1]